MRISGEVRPEVLLNLEKDRRLQIFPILPTVEFSLLDIMITADPRQHFPLPALSSAVSLSTTSGAALLPLLKCLNFFSWFQIVTLARK